MQLANDRLACLLPEWHLLLKAWSADGRITAAAQEALLLNGEPQALTDLTKQWAAGEFGGLPPIVLLSSADINGALGAYAISTGTIYLNADWLAGASKEQVFSVLTEELGHHLDGLLNAVDTPGDEGEYFSDLLRGATLTNAGKARLRTGSDSGTITAVGSILTVELASLSETQVNQYTAGNQSDPYTLALGNGTFIIGWTSDGQDGSQTGVYARIYSSAGTPITGEFRVNTYTDSYQGYPRFADLGGGKFVATFGTWHNDQSGGIAAQIYNYDGTPVGSEFQVNTYTSSNQTWGEVTALKGGGFIVTWESYYQDGSELGIYAQRFNQDGSKNGSEFLVNNITVGDQAKPNVAGLDDGGFIITWVTDNNTGKAGYNVKARRYDASGNALDVEFYVNSQTSGSTNNVPIVRSNGAGGYIVLWTDSSKSSGGPRIFGKIFNSAGNALSGEISISEWTTGGVSAATLTVLPSGNFIAEWNSSDQDSSGLGVYAREFTPLGVPVGTEYRVNTTTAGNQGNPSVASNQNGDVMYAWHSDNSDGSGYGIVAGLTKGNSPPTDITASNSTFDENIAPNSAIATFTTTDPDSGDTFIYSLVWGTGSTDNSAFTISGDKLLINSTPNYEAKSSYSLRVRTTDAGGLFTEKAITLGVNNVKEVIRGNSLYTIVDGPSWTQAEANAVELGGHLASINNAAEDQWVYTSFVESNSLVRWIGATDAAQEGIWKWTDGSPWEYTNWAPLEPNNGLGTQEEDYLQYDLSWGGLGWQDFIDLTGPGSIHSAEYGIAEVPIVSSITRTGAVKEGAGVFTTSINLSAGTQASGNLADGSQVWWRISGITADDLATGALTGNGFITNGKLDIQHSLVIDSDTAEQFTVTVYSDAAMTQQIGTVNTTFIEESDITPPTISSISTQGTTVTLKFSETISALPVSITAFTVATVSSSGQATNRTINTVSRDLNDPTKLILTLTGTPPASNVNLRVSYTDPAGAQSTGDVQDLAGNDLANFSRFADTFLTSSTSTLANQYQNLILTLTSNVNGTGNALNNSITGNGANNTLSGLTGADTMAGGLGNDTYIVDNTGDVVTEDLNAGTDTVQSSITYTLGANLENLTLTGSAAINGTGNALNNVLTGNSAANILSGGDGSDTLIGGAGADTLTGSTGADTFRFALADSRFAAFDRITDFTIGTDILDGPTAVTNTNLRELGSVSALTATAIGSVLTTANFARNGAATFSFGSGPTARTFLAVNDGTAGFSSTNDSLIEITGYTGLLTNLAIV